MKLQRLTQTDYATYGQLYNDSNEQMCVTLELPWQDNQHAVSCIPAGPYIANRFSSPKRDYDVFELMDVPDRGAIELHIGNTTRDTEGCILLGSAFGQVHGEPGITGSRDAFRRFMDRMKNVDSFSLEILDVP